ncbi:MAG TPA: hypothetical protein VFU63_15045 [Ktedonobacterales bacterium]|nr:hypothetical protein [Ktedonobacterales bacterium]
MGTKHREGRPERASGESERRGASGAGIAGVLAVILLTVGLAGCATNASVNGPTPVPTFSDGGTPGAHATLTLPTSGAVTSPSGTTGQQGVKEFCSKSPEVSIHPASNVPVYPGATLHFSQASGANAFYGFCTGDSTGAVQNFYSTQLPKSGWSSLQATTIATVVQISATQCAKQGAPQIIVTIAPDSTGTTTTSISIIVLAGSC